MHKILTIEKAITIAEQVRQEEKKIILAGGCFDILHLGHIEFLEAAKKAGDILFVMLESDETITRLKGDQRPINTQENRARILSALAVVDYVILLPELKTDIAYNDLVFALKPVIIAATKADPNIGHKKRQANMVGATVLEVIDYIPQQSTSKLAALLFKETI